MTPARPTGTKLAAACLWVGVACLVGSFGYFGWWLAQSENADALSYFAVGCAFIALCLVAWSCRWQPPKGRDE
jgi:membrane protein DedA with SNARE-associated domain